MYQLTKEERDYLITSFGKVEGNISFRPLLMLTQLKEIKVHEKVKEPTVLGE